MEYNDLLEYEGLIRSIANKFYGISKDDLYQAGFLGLIKAHQNYHDPNIKFSTYAYKYIYGEMYNLVLSIKNVKGNKNLLKLKKIIDKIKEHLEKQFNREIYDQEIIDYLGITYAEYEMANITNLSIENDYYLKVEDLNKDELLTLYDSLNKLSALDRDLIIRRYFYDYSQQELASIYGTTQTSISRHEKKLMQKLNKYVA
ncbi:MAG: sigma-70 family RNA polymerase sigma factor [Bacilli bacterium]|nr:sigma-70 family RNA polymerase sigma factor [Bacilli bacterium]